MAHLVIIPIEEPNLAQLSQDDSPRFLNLSEDREVALQRYQALMGVMVSQLVGLVDCHVRFIINPSDGVDAVKFWILSELRGEVVQSPDSLEESFTFTPEQHAESITLEFCAELGETSAFQKVAQFNPYCVSCGARWINLAFLQSKENLLVEGEGYLTVEHENSSEDKELLKLPELEIVDSDRAWEAALKTHLSGKLTKQLERITLNQS